MRGICRGRLQRERQHTLHILVAQLVRGAGTRLVHKSIQTGLKIAPPPLAHRVLHGVESAGNGCVAEPIGGQQNDPRPHGQRLRRLRSFAPGNKLSAVPSDEKQPCEWTTFPHRTSSHSIRCSKFNLF